MCLFDVEVYPFAFVSFVFEGQHPLVQRDSATGLCHGVMEPMSP
jgi:hypothetical protein